MFIASAVKLEFWFGRNGCAT